MKILLDAADKDHWEAYARETFDAHVNANLAIGGPVKLRQLQYVTAQSKAWWQSRIPDGAILL